jgi:hypothetical protein
MRNAEVRVNQKLVWESGDGYDFSGSIEVPLALIPGVNSVSVTAYNKIRGPRTERLTLHRASKSSEKTSKLFILSVGINKYRQNHLTFCVNDASSMMEELKKGCNDFFKEVVPVLLKDDEACKTRIEGEIKKISENAGPNDVVIIFFAGHGVSLRTTDEKRLFAFLPFDYPWRGDEETAVKRFGIRGDFIAEQVRSMKPQKVVLIMDCCQSGDLQLALAGTRAVGVNNRDMLNRLANGTGIFLLTASAGKELAREHVNVGHGLFTHVMLKALGDRKADQNGDGVISIKELGRYSEQIFEGEYQRFFGNAVIQSPVVTSLGRDEMSMHVLDFPLKRIH